MAEAVRDGTKECIPCCSSLAKIISANSNTLNLFDKFTSVLCISNWPVSSNTSACVTPPRSVPSSWLNRWISSAFVEFGISSAETAYSCLRAFSKASMFSDVRSLPSASNDRIEGAFSTTRILHVSHQARAFRMPNE